MHILELTLSETFVISMVGRLTVYHNMSIIMCTILTLKWWSEVGVRIIHV